MPWLDLTAAAGIIQWLTPTAGAVGQLVGFRVPAYPLATQRAEHPEGPQQYRDQHDEDHDRDDVVPDAADHKSHAPSLRGGQLRIRGCPGTPGAGRLLTVAYGHARGSPSGRAGDFTETLASAVIIQR